MDGLSLRNLDTSQQLGKLTESSANKTESRLKDNNVVEGMDSFASTLKSAIKSVDTLQKDADVKMQQLSVGKSTDIHGTMIAAEKAEIALKFMMQVRNKVIDAYHEIMKMQV